MAKWANDVETSIFFIDYNLKDHKGDGINGDELIKEIHLLPQETPEKEHLLKEIAPKY